MRYRGLIYQSLVDLKANISQIKHQFLDKHLADPLITDNIYRLDINAFCVLSHAYFEQYFEELSSVVCDSIVEAYKNHKKVSIGTLMLMHLISTTKFPYKSEDTSLKNIYDYVNQDLHKSKVILIESLKGNHGASLKYLKNILIPVGIDVPSHPIYMDSLQKLVSERGVFAHGNKHNGTIRRPYTPSQANSIVNDCLELAVEINKLARQIAER